MNWFRDERGSTSLGVVLAVVLVLALMAVSLQGYWTSSSSADIQTLADLGALSAADAGAKVVACIQVLDALLLTANLFGLVLHCVVVVAGVLSVVASPVGGSGAVAFFDKALEFDRKFCEKRRDFAQDVQKLAQALCEAAPYLSLAQSYRTVQVNAQTWESFTGAQYVSVAIPLPARGTVELTGFPAEEKKLLREVAKANEENSDRAAAIQTLEREVERGRETCFRLDVFKPAGTTLVYWEPTSAFDDFKRGFRELAQREVSIPTHPAPIEDTGANRARLTSNVQDEYDRLTTELKRGVPAAIGSAPAGSEKISASDIRAASLLESRREQRYWLLQHTTGERRAYHDDRNCFGLAGATHALGRVRLSEVEGDDDHPPCVLCAPPHWRAVALWSAPLEDFCETWNEEAAALRAWSKAKERLKAEQTQLTEDVGSALTDIVKEAKTWLAGGRLRYAPAGARGWLCIVATTNERALPDFTLPPLTAASELRLGRQVAIAAARLMPSTRESTIPSLLADTQPSGDSVLGWEKAVGALLSVEGLGGSFVARLWGSCLDLYTKGAASFDALLSGLPWGLDTVFAPALRKLLSAAEVTPPDLRRFQPALVDSSAIGDEAASGPEGSIVSVLRSGKRILRDSYGANTAGIQAALSVGIDEFCADFSGQIERLTELRILGVAISLPFSAQIKQLCAQAVAAVRARRRELLAGLGG
ncbi:MAG: hypothetical protein LBJ07_03215 [Actinomycetes bacterium]|jgi:hypothetical protein|nr:hypothetical protein [Actinomycetes bacterium]